MRLSLLLVLLAAGCQGGAATCDDEAQCAAVCPVTSDRVFATQPREGGEPEVITLTDAEWAVFGPELQRARAGVKPAAPHGVGVAGGPYGEQRPPDDAGALPPGRYRLRADLDIPNFGGFVWDASAQQTCVTDVQEGEEIAHHRKQDVLSAQLKWESPARPTTWDGLFPFESPNPEGRKRCAWRISLRHLQDHVEFEGSYEVPAAGVAPALAPGSTGGAAAGGGGGSAPPADPAAPGGSPMAPPSPPASAPPSAPPADGATPPG